MTRGLPFHSGLRSGELEAEYTISFQNVRTRAAEGVRYGQQSRDHDITLVTLVLRKTTQI